LQASPVAPKAALIASWLPVFGATGEACKACHDDFRKKH
jgi:cytochrome c556